VKHKVYHFAIVALLALATYRTVDFVLSLLGIELPSAIKTFVTLGTGVLATELLDYSVFAGWGVSIREAWMGPFFTGLMVGSLTYVWPTVIDSVAGMIGRGSSSESRPRAA
jgi:uncharacterized membrane protein